MPLVQANRQARTLRLTSSNDLPQVVTAAGLAAKHTPTSDFELEIAELLKESGHQDAASVAKVHCYSSSFCPASVAWHPLHVCAASSISRATHGVQLQADQAVERCTARVPCVIKQLRVLCGASTVLLTAEAARAYV